MSSRSLGIWLAEKAAVGPSGLTASKAPRPFLDGEDFRAVERGGLALGAAWEPGGSTEAGPHQPPSPVCTKAWLAPLEAGHLHTWPPLPSLQPSPQAWARSNILCGENPVLLSTQLCLGRSQEPPLLKPTLAKASTFRQRRPWAVQGSAPRAWLQSRQCGSAPLSPSTLVCSNRVRRGG